MFKKLLLILALICMIVLPVFSQTGNYTSNEYFYLPKYGAYGTDEYNEYNLYMEKADNQIETNKSGIAAIDLSLYYLKTEIDTQAKVEAIWVKDITDSDELAAALGAYYLKTAIDSQGEVETIWDVTLATDTELAALKFTDLTDTPAAYDNGKYAKSTADGVVWDTPAGYTNLTSFVDQTAWRLFYSNTDGDVVELPLGTEGQVLTSSGASVAPSFEDAGGAGETNTASNVGWTSDDTEAKLFKQKDGVDLKFRSLKEGTGINFTWISDAGLKKYNETHDSDGAVYPTIYDGEYWIAGSSYVLDNIQVLCYRIGTGNTVTMHIYEADIDGFPTGDELANKTVDCTGITTSDVGEWVAFDLSASSINIASATKYCYYLTSDDGNISNCTKVNYQNTDAVADAWRIWYGGSWFKHATKDHAFKIYSATAYHDYVQVGITDGNIILLSTTTISFAADADTTLYTVPTGKRCVLTKAIVVAADDAGATTTISIGANGAETDFIPANTLSNLDAQYDSVILQPIPNTTPLKNKSYAAATVIEAQVASQSGVAGNTIYLFGITY